MSKKGIYKIAGNISPIVGVETLYYIAEWYPDTLLSERNPAKVTWELFKKQKKGQFATTNIKKVGISSFTFGEKAWRYTYRLEAYLHEPEGKEPMSLIISPQVSKVPRINKVELHYVDDTKGNTFSFFEKLRAKAHCVNLANEELLFTLWEDDVNGKGHNPKNLLVETAKAKVKPSNGIAVAEFMLTKGLMQKAMRGEHDGQLEFYVTVEYFKNKKHDSENVNVNNPLYKKPQETKALPSDKPKPVSKPPSKAKGSPAEQKPKSKKEEKGIWETVWSKGKEVVDYAESALSKATKDKEPTKQVDDTNKPVMVDVPDKKEGGGTCICKDEYKLIWGGHIKMTCEKRKKIVEVCKNIWGETQKIEKANMLMAVMHLETAGTFDQSKKGISSGGTKYIGLVQFSGTTASSLGTSYDALAKMTFVEQMDYVEKYLKQNKDKMKTLVDFYLQVLKPSDVGKGDQPNHAIFNEGIAVPDGDGSGTSKAQRDKNITQEPWVTKYGYASNATFMVEKNEKIKRKKWVYTRQQYEQRYGFDNGKTYIWEIDQILKQEHYIPGEGYKFLDKCENVKEEKKKADGKRSPWMEIVLDEAKNYGGYDEGDNPLNTRIKNEYFSIPNEFTTKETNPSSISWCAAFASWCLKKAGYSNPSKCRALEFNPDYLHDGPTKPDRPSGMRKIAKPVYGCIVVWKNVKGGCGHVAFHYGYESNGNVVPLGGNQGSSLKFSSRSPSGDYGQTIVGYYLPENYNDNSEDEFTSEEMKINPKVLNKSRLLKSSNEEVSGKTT